MLTNHRKRLARLLSGPAVGASVSVEVNATVIRSARPGDLLLLTVDRVLTEEQRDEVRTRLLGQVKDLAPGVIPIVLEGGFRAVLVPTGPIE